MVEPKKDVMQMPRVVVNKKKYKLADLQNWITGQIHAQGLKQSQVAYELGISQQALSERLKPPKNKRKDKDSFSYGDLLVLFKLFNTPAEEVVKLMRL